MTVRAESDEMKVWKIIALDTFSVLFAGMFGYSFLRYLAGGFSFWFVLVALLLWGAVSVLQGFLQQKTSHRILIIFFESIALILFFYTYAWQSLAITAALVLIVLVWGYFSVRRALGNAIEIRFFNLSSKVVGKVVTAAVIFMIVMYASLANNNGNFFVSENGFNVFFTWAAGFVNNFYPTVPLTGSFSDFAQAIARMQLQGNPTFQQLTPAEQSAALAQSSDEVMSALSNESSTAITSSTATEPASNAIYDYLAGVSAKLQARFNNLFIGAWGLILFLILRSIGIIVVWVGQFVALIFYELLLSVGFMKISEQPATKENFEL